MNINKHSHAFTTMSSHAMKVFFGRVVGEPIYEDTSFQKNKSAKWHCGPHTPICNKKHN